MATTVYIIGNWAGTRGKETWVFAYEGSKVSASGKIDQPYTTKPLYAGAVEGALFDNTIDGAKQGAGKSIQWMIDPRVSFLKGTKPKPDSIVGWATINLTVGSPSSRGYEVYPVRASTGDSWQKGDVWYSFSTSEALKVAPESKL